MSERAAIYVVSDNGRENRLTTRETHQSPRREPVMQPAFPAPEHKAKIGTEDMSSKSVGSYLFKGALAGVLCSTVSLVALSSAAMAQTTSTPAATSAVSDPSTEITIVGIRRSLRSSEDIKKNASGVVDAITAEDIGKFPDTNLAEAIQRIPGVTIDRNNNEGSRITVRGFGSDFNLVTLNGRSMPGSISDTSGSATRSFDFENISADGIAGVDVYKTGRADMPSGGIGATVDIRTARPFDYKGMKASLQAKMIDDTSLDKAKLTPEISGLFSNTFDDGHLGFLVNGSYSERDSRLESANIGGYLENQDLSHAQTLGTLTNNNKNPYGNTWAPQSEAWGFDDHHRTRVNGQAVLQWRPMDNLTATVDYTYALYKDHVVKHSYGAWFGYGGDLDSATVNSEGNVTDIVDTGSDLSMSTFDDQLRNELKSTGLNVKWQPTDSLTVTFDAHHSSTFSGAGPAGNNDFLIVGFDPIYSQYKIYHEGGTDIPTTQWTWNSPATMAAYQAANPSVTLHNTSPTSSTNLNTAMITPLFAQANTNDFVNTIDEQRGDAVWRNGSDGGLKDIKFGFDLTKMQTQFTAYNSGNFALGYYDPHSENMIPSSVFTKLNSCDILKSFSGGGCDIKVPYAYTFSLQDAVNATKGAYNYTLGFPSTPTSDHHIEEQTNAIYAQMDFDTDFNGMRFKMLMGLRYENTQVTAKSLEQVPVSVTWQNPTEFYTQYSPTLAYSDVKKKYDEILPSIDTSLAVTKDFLLRASYSKTLTRSDLNSMVGTESVSLTPKPGSRTVTAGNPGLLPYESNNLDLTAEWYPTRDDYFSVNYFSKEVVNFLTQTTTQGPVDGLTDPNAGAIEQKAAAEVAAAHKDPTAANIFAQMEADTGQTSFAGQPGDPLIIWDITMPSNANKVNIHGFEFSAQHIFGDTGFGFQANISLPAGGPKFNDQIIGSQFVLPGLSKSYNLVAFYEKHGWQARLAYTHRSEYLSALSQGQGPNEPQYVEPYGQLDGSASYDVNDHLAIFLDGINLTKSNLMIRGRFKDQFLNAFEGNARYTLGVRYKF